MFAHVWFHQGASALHFSLSLGGEGWGEGVWTLELSPPHPRPLSPKGRGGDFAASGRTLQSTGRPRARRTVRYSRSGKGKDNSPFQATPKPTDNTRARRYHGRAANRDRCRAV